MGSSIEAAVLAALEQAEMAARERRLSASTQAEEIVSAARQQAAGITAEAGRRVDEDLDALRRASEAEADSVIEDLERAARRPNPGAGLEDASASFERAVAIVVAHVLGEAVPDPGGEGRS